MARNGEQIILTEEEKQTLVLLSRQTKGEQRTVLRAKIILEWSLGKNFQQSQKSLCVSQRIINKWRRRFSQRRIAGLSDAPRSGKPSVISAPDKAKVIELACSKPGNGYTSWSQRRIASEVKMSQSKVHFGFKLHLIINDKGEMLSFYLTKGNVDDRNTKAITEMTKELFGKLFGDKGYISKVLSDLLWGNGIQLITAVRKNMKTKALSNEEKLLLRKRSVIETVNDELKNICQLEHTRHRSISGFLLNIMGALAAYSFFPKKPSIKKDIEETNPKFIKQHLQQLQLAA